MQSVKFVGIVNVTPDSFSDGGSFCSSSDAIEQGMRLIEEGADVIDIGGDSTRPGSKCVGKEEEWKRIEEVVTNLAACVPVSVDTHHAEVAEKAIERGATMINDVSAGGDSEMFSFIAQAGVKIVLMYSRCTTPHSFDGPPSGDVVEAITKFLSSRIKSAQSAGVKKGQILIDSGMGAFLHNDPTVSWELLERYAEVAALGYPLILGISRKGFLKRDEEVSLLERDKLSAESAFRVSRSFSSSNPLYLRVHNVACHIDIFRAESFLPPMETPSLKGRGSGGE